MKNNEISKKQRKRLESYEIGDNISIGTKTYATLFNRYNKKITKDPSKCKKYNSEQVEKDLKNKKTTRPVVVIWNNKYSNHMILSSLTTSKKKNLNFNLEKNSFANLEMLIFNKKKYSVSFDGMVFKKFEEKKIDEYLAFFKKQRPKTYLMLIEQINRLQKLSNEIEIKLKDEQIKQLLNR